MPHVDPLKVPPLRFGELVPKRERLAVDFGIGQREYFLRQSSSGMIIGPKSKDAYDRHVTFAFDLTTEELRHVHMKSGRKGSLQENWRIIPRRVPSDVSAWIMKNSVSIRREAISELDHSVDSFSTRRMMVSFSIVEPVLTRIVWIVFRSLGIVRFSSAKTNETTHIQATIDFARLLRHLRRFRPFRNFLGALARTLIPRASLFLAKIHRVRLADMTKGDVCLVFPKQGQDPSVIVKDDQYLQVPLELVISHAMAWFTNLKLSEMMPDLTSSPVQAVPIHIRTRGVKR